MNVFLQRWHRFPNLSILEKWSSLAVSACSVRAFMASFNTGLLSKDPWDCDDERDEENDSHDGECKDPLEGKDFGTKLTKSQSSHQERSSKSNVIILENQQEESGEDQEVPDGNVGKDPAGEALAVNHDGAVPEEGEFNPGQRQGDGWEVNPSRSRRVAKIESYELAPIDCEHEFRKEVMGASPEHNPSKLKEIEQDKVGSDTGSFLDVSGVLGEEMPDVTDLSEEQSDPIDADKDVAGREGGVVTMLEIINSMIVVVLSIGGSAGGIHDREDQVEQETQDGDSFVGGNIALGTFTVPGKWIWERHLVSAP